MKSFIILIYLVSSIQRVPLQDNHYSSLEKLNKFINKIDKIYNLKSDSVYKPFVSGINFNIEEVILNEYNIDLSLNNDSIIIRNVFKKWNKAYESSVFLEIFIYKNNFQPKIIKEKLDSVSNIPFDKRDDLISILPQYYIIIDNLVILITDFYCDYFEDIKKEAIKYFPKYCLSNYFFIDYSQYIRMKPEFLFDTTNN
ncbi:MAG: hypothetical protein JXB00_16500 [Bacteroidales bacterium]|nr:hypothetical protein [Bacteroidales bacterium]